MKNIKKILGAVLLVVMVMTGFRMAGNVVHASEVQMLYVSVDTKMQEAGDEGSGSVMDLKAGTLVALLEEGDVWDKISYQTKEGYVKASELQVENTFTDLGKEMAQMQEEDNLFANEVIRVRKEKVASRIWGGVIVLIVIMIFGSGIYTTMNNKKREELADRVSDGELQSGVTAN